MKLQQTLTLTKKGEAAARVSKLSRVAEMLALLDLWFQVSRLTTRVVSK